MLVFLNKKKTIPLDDIILISHEKSKSKKKKTVILTVRGKKIIEKNSVAVLIKRIEKQKGFLKEK